jgi:UDP-N-acetylmuramoylalanine-D-glutamate ligase
MALLSQTIIKMTEIAQEISSTTNLPSDIEPIRMVGTTFLETLRPPIAAMQTDANTTAVRCRDTLGLVDKELKASDDNPAPAKRTEAETALSDIHTDLQRLRTTSIEPVMTAAPGYLVKINEDIGQLNTKLADLGRERTRLDTDIEKFREKALHDIADLTMELTLEVTLLGPAAITQIQDMQRRTSETVMPLITERNTLMRADSDLRQALGAVTQLRDRFQDFVAATQGINVATQSIGTNLERVLANIRNTDTPIGHVFLNAALLGLNRLVDDLS